jgi:hypothetical protein
MARKQRREKPEGPTVRFVLGCRRGIHVDQRVGRDLMEDRQYIERTELSTFEGRAHELARPSGYVETEELKCSFCNRMVKVQVASPVAAALSQYQGCIWALVIGGALTVLCATLPDIVATSAKHVGGPLGIAQIVGGLSGVALLFAAFIGFNEPPLAHVVWTRDYKHVIAADTEEDDEDDDA